MNERTITSRKFWKSFGSRTSRTSTSDGSKKARRRSLSIQLESLEARQVLSTFASLSVVAPPAQTEGAGRLHFNLSSDSTSSVLPNGDIAVTTPVPSYTPSDVRTYRNGAAGWQMVSWNRWEGVGLLSVWKQSVWNADGSFTETGWGGAGPGFPQYYSMTFAQNKATFSLYGVRGAELYYGATAEDTTSGTQTWTYNLAKDGSLNKMLEYHASQDDWRAAADWANPTLNKNPNDYASGWGEWYPNYYSVAVPTSEWSGLDSFNDYVNSMGRFVKGGNQPLAVPPTATEQTRNASGHFVDTFWNNDKTASISFIYATSAKKTLLEQIYGSTVNGKWVTVADHSKVYIKRTETFDKLGGNLLSSVRVFTGADGRTATLSGTWTSGTALANATGTETGGPYLGFDSVTIDYQNGAPITRTGTLSQRYGSSVATDTFQNGAVTQRVIASVAGGQGTQHWTSSGKNKAQIFWNTPDPTTSNLTFFFQKAVPHAFNQGYRMMRLRAVLTKPVDFSFQYGDSYKEITSTSYKWYKTLTLDSDGSDYDWNYRQSAGNSIDFIASSTPGNQLPFNTVPPIDPFWNVQ